MTKGRGPEQALVVGSDVSRAGSIAEALHSDAIVPCLAFTSAQALSCAGLYDFRLLIVDSLRDNAAILPLINGLRARTTAPLIVVARETSPLVESSADCVLPRGAAVGEIARRALSLLTISRPPDLPATLSWGPLELDVARRLARWYLKPLRLTSIQFRMMEVLMLAGGSVVSTRDLARRIWGQAILEDEDRIRAHVWRIRKLIETKPSDPEFLLTVRGEGFRLADYEVTEPDIDLTPLDRGRSGESLIRLS